MTYFNVVLCVFCMRGSRNFRQGGAGGGGVRGVQAHLTEKALLSENPLTRVCFVVF